MFDYWQIFYSQILVRLFCEYKRKHKYTNTLANLFSKLQIEQKLLNIYNIFHDTVNYDSFIKNNNEKHFHTLLNALNSLKLSHFGRDYLL